MSIVDENPWEPCAICAEPVNTDDGDACVYVPVGNKYELPAHRTCRERQRVEDGPTDAE